MPALNANQIKQAYEGYAGWNDPAAIMADFRATGGSGKGGPGIASGGQFFSSGGRQRSQDVYANLSSQYGLGDLKTTAKSLSEQIFKIEDYLKGVEGDVQQRSGEFLMTDPQQRRLMASESEPSRKSLAELSTSYGRTTSNIASITGDINTQLGLVMADQKYQDDIKNAAANVGVVVTGNESMEDLLAAIAGKVNANDLWEKAFKMKQLSKSGATGTATERGATAALGRLRAEIAAGANYNQLGPRYQAELPLSQIREEYNKGPTAKQYGPAKETASEEALWGVKPKAAGGTTMKYQLPDGTIVEF